MSFALSPSAVTLRKIPVYGVSLFLPLEGEILSLTSAFIGPSLTAVSARPGAHNGVPASRADMWSFAASSPTLGIGKRAPGVARAFSPPGERERYSQKASLSLADYAVRSGIKRPRRLPIRIPAG